jgi:hypothetical protein
MSTQLPPSIPIPISNHAKSSSGSSDSGSTLSPQTPLAGPGPFSMPTPRVFASSPNQGAGLFRWGFPGSLSKSPTGPPGALPIGSPPRGDDEVGAMTQRHDRSVSIAVSGQGVMGEKQARGQGVLRRLSLGGGANFARVSGCTPHSAERVC